jgi:uncharacterized membrane protein
MLEWLFKYPGVTFRKGQFVLLAPWPVWLLAGAILVAAGLLFWHVRRHRGALTGARPAAIWLLETAMVALVLFLLWHPALSVATLRPQQNVVAILVDDSRSMGLREGSSTRLEEARRALGGGLLDALGKRFQVRLYGFGRDAERIQKLDQLHGERQASRIADGLKEVLEQSSTLPLGAIVLLSDGADNTGGIGRETVERIRQGRIPVHTIGFGRERPERDIEISDAIVPARALPDSRLTAQVTFRQFGYAGERARLSVRNGDKVLATQEVKLKSDGVVQAETLLFDAGGSGPKTIRISIDPLPGEENRENNALNRLINVASAKARLLYVEGEPRWEYKFIRRAADDDHSLEMASMLRTTQNKLYRQGIANPKDLEDGFPARAEDLFAYQGLIIGSVEAGYFTPAQQELIREFANRRGGGVLFLGGRFALSDGGYQHTPLAEMMPLRLPEAGGTFHRDQSAEVLTPQGLESVICRLDEDAARNAERWKKMPLVANYNDVGEPKPGAVVLMNVVPPKGGKIPLLAVQNYGRGRAAVFATGGSWRWKMWLEHTDRSHPMFWQQMMRWLAAEAPGPVMISTSRQVVADETAVPLRVEVRGKDFKPRSDVQVQARVMGPDGPAGTVELTPQPLESGVYTTVWNAEKPGAYVVEVMAHRGQEEIGGDVLQFRREDGVAENFRMSQNRELLEKLADETGGRYFKASEAGKLASEIAYSEAGITTRETRDLWDMPAVFLLAFMLRASEWLLRRKWGVV